MTGLCARTMHRYTRGLMASIPRRMGKQRARRLKEIPGIVPSLRDPIPGCAFADRCGFVVERCPREAEPQEVRPDQRGDLGDFIGGDAREPRDGGAQHEQPAHHVEQDLGFSPALLNLAGRSLGPAHRSAGKGGGQEAGACGGDRGG